MARAILGPEPSASLNEEQETSTEVEQVEWKWKSSRGMKEIDPTVGGCSNSSGVVGPTLGIWGSDGAVMQMDGVINIWIVHSSGSGYKLWTP